MGNRWVVRALFLLAVLGGCGRNEPGFPTAATQGQASPISDVTSSSARTSNPVPPASTGGDAAPHGGRCGDDHQVEVANYFVARGLDVSVAVEVDCMVLVTATNVPQEVLDWLKSRPYRIDLIDLPPPVFGTGKP